MNRTFVKAGHAAHRAASPPAARYGTATATACVIAAGAARTAAGGSRRTSCDLGSSSDNNSVSSCWAYIIIVEPKVLALVRERFQWRFPSLEKIQGVLDAVPRGPWDPRDPLS